MHYPGFEKSGGKFDHDSQRCLMYVHTGETFTANYLGQDMHEVRGYIWGLNDSGNEKEISD